MKQIYKAKIIWLSKDCGGRSGGIPSGDKYVLILVPKGFDLDLNNNWSTFVENVNINKKMNQ